MFNLFGPIAIIVSILIQACMCSMIMCCMVAYRKSVKNSEENPQNPANQYNTD